MNIELTKNFMNIVQKHSPNCFINYNYELIVEPKNNIYFRLEDIETELELKCKVLAWLSRPSCKGISNYWQKRIRAIVNEFLGTEFTFDEMAEIYTYLGNDCNREKSIKFIKSNYDLDTLTS
ncbi:hypothetical protein AL714_16290 [Clostridium botulinum]|uniref:hypothetical protein n=1 Tax=Clostridium botulinum TaxID=1491 RepID=UPI00099BE5E0|nr:hypothetical protein [Clostridium botulinum]MCC5439806.1 hypothetical protein [Clostridium botulinum]NFR57596.1 hypothetical protein [Clostridium botulinum]OPD35914.1 hypothetical protein AL714_16290 [Clostridium botulinum]